MPRPAKTDTKYAEQLAEELKTEVEIQMNRAPKHAQAEFRAVISYIDIVIGKLPRIQQLSEFSGYKYAVIDQETGNLRPATLDEATRLIMRYPQKGDILEYVKEYDRRIYEVLQRELKEKFDEFIGNYASTSSQGH